MDIATAIVTILISSPLMAVIMHLLNRRARHAEARIKNAEADKTELSNKRDEVAHYRSVINDLVADMEALGVAQDKTDKRYQDNTKSLHVKIDGLTAKLDKANKTISELEQEVKKGGEKTDALVNQLNRANESLDAANLEIKGLREVITGLQEKVTELLMERAEKK